MTSEPTKPAEPWTVRRVLDWTTAHLKKHGSEAPRLETEILLAHARGCRRIDLYTHYDDVLDDDVRTRMRDLVQRRAKSEPVAYLVGHREFFSLGFRVTRDVLIPRPDTETLVMELLKLAKSFEAPRILDVGTGSGCIAIATAVNHRTAQLTAVDVSEAALGVARENAATHGVAERIRFVRGNLFAPLEAAEPFQIIASNPPYVDTAVIETLEADVRAHEPCLALDGGPAGLVVLKRLIDAAPPYLVPGGYLLLEFSPEQVEPLTGFARANELYADVAVVKDLAGDARVLRLRKQE